MKDMRSRGSHWLGGASVALLQLLLHAPIARATVAPADGTQFPPEYVRYKRDHPELFALRGGLQDNVDRARARRQRILSENAGRSAEEQARAVAADPRALVSGSIQIPIIAVNYSNVSAPYPTSTLQTTLFGANPTGNLTQYYTEVSYGNLTVTGTVFGWTALANPDTTYEGTNKGLPPGGNTGQLLTDALNAVDGSINFGVYDNDGPDGIPNSGDDDGFVDFISFVHPESGGECGNSNIWSHRWVYSGWNGSAYTTNDARTGGGFIRINNYTIQPARNCGGGDIEIGVFAHEFGHVFGIPDLYDTDGTSNGLGHWSLMAAGNWNTPARPAHWDAWSRSEVGWLTPTLLTSSTSGLSIPQIETSPTAFRVSIGNGLSYFIENRQPVGSDQNLATCGLAIYLVDEPLALANKAANSVNRLENCGAFKQSPPGHQAIALKQADGLCNLEGKANRGDAGDLFPGSSKKKNFSGSTTPSSIDYDGNDWRVAVKNISNCGATMTADIDAFPIPAPPVAPLDVVFLIDTTGSYVDDLPNIQAQMPGMVSGLSAAFPNIRFGLAEFKDFPFSSFGDPSDVAYQIRQTLTSSQATFVAQVNALTATGGSDEPEAQYEALYQLLTGAGRDLNGDSDTVDAGEIAPSNIGWTSGRARVVYLLTDASFHDSDVENYPGTPLKAAGRTLVRSLLKPKDPVLFTMVADNSNVFVTDGQSADPPDIGGSVAFSQGGELAALTGGGVVGVGTDSADLALQVSASIQILQQLPLVPPTISGGALLVSDKGSPTTRKLLFQSKDRVIDTGIAGIDPVRDGAFLHIYNPATGESACLSLPSFGNAWTATGKPDKPTFKYRDATSANGPCTAAKVSDAKQIKVTCRSKSLPIDFSLDEPSQGSLAVRFISGAKTYCTSFGGTIVKDVGTAGGKPGQFKAIKAQAPGTCPATPVDCP